MRKIQLIAFAVSALFTVAANAGQLGLVEPRLHLQSRHSAPTVALTFDACGGATDMRILNSLVEKQIPVTIFVTAKWLRRNPRTVKLLIAHRGLFEIENHGANHVPAIDRPMRVYGIAAAGSPGALEREVDGGSVAIVATGASAPRWYRGATAKYSMSAIRQIKAMGYRIAGYTVNGDGGSLLGTRATLRAFSKAKDGDVIIAHINQPTHNAGAGVVKGIEALQKRGFHFVRLMDAIEN